jgi:hypothetical protein
MTEEETSHKERLSRMKDIMVAKGMKHLGKGKYGHVFQSKSTGHVIKIFRPDSGYISFLKLIRDNKNNPHFPKIRKIVSFKHKNNKGLHLIKLEKLNPISQDEYEPIGSYAYSTELNPKGKSNVKFRSENPAFADALDKVVSNSTGNLDIHRGNIMKRDNGQFVITDPYYSEFMSTGDF